MYNLTRTIRTMIKAPKLGVFTAIGVLALTALFAGCPIAPIGGGDTTTAPSAPANLVVEFGNGQATLTWDAVDGVDEYRIYRADGPDGDFEQLTTAAAITATTYTDAGLEDGTVYRYMVRAVRGGVESGGNEEKKHSRGSPRGSRKPYCKRRRWSGNPGMGPGLQCCRISGIPCRGRRWHLFPYS